MRDIIQTMGLANRDLGTILEILAVARVKRVVDIRRYGSAGRYPQHEARFLHRELLLQGYEVCDLGALLGGDRRGGYPRYMESAAFARGMEKLEALASLGATMLLCAEREPGRCHRRFLAEALEERGWKVAHHVHTLAERTARGEMRVVRKTG